MSSLDMRQRWIASLLLLGMLAALLFFVRLGATGLFDADEPAYAGATREMLERGDWITPRFNGRPRFDKPGTAAGLLSGPAWRPAVLGAMAGAPVLTAVVWIAPTVYEIQQGALREYAEEARRALGPEGVLVAYGLNAPSVVFYAHRSVTPLGPSSPEDVEQLRRLVGSGRPVLVIARADEASRLAGVPGLEPVKSRGGYALYGSVPPAPGPGGGRTTP